MIAISRHDTLDYVLYHNHILVASSTALDPLVDLLIILVERGTDATNWTN